MGELDEEFLARAKEEGLRDGSTAVAAVFAGGKLTIAHVGDSRCILLGVDRSGDIAFEVGLSPAPAHPAATLREVESDIIPLSTA